ncbi:MAG: response regulator [Candidatus Sericytochromatia bacterium]
MIKEHPKVLIVEDQNIVALDLENSLRSLKYNVTGIAFSGAGAIKKTQETLPDIILMDITLKGDMDGINAAQEIKKRFDIPIIYLTAYTDSATIERAKKTEPLGYLIKPFEEKELNRVIELALYKHKIDKKTKEKEVISKSILNSLDSAIIRLNKDLNIIFANKKFLEISEYTEKELYNKSLKELFISLNLDGAYNDKEVILITRSGDNKLLSLKINYDNDDNDLMIGINIILDELKENNTLFSLKYIEKSINLLLDICNNHADGIFNTLTGLKFNFSVIEKNNNNELIINNINFMKEYGIKLEKNISNLFEFSQKTFIIKETVPLLNILEKVLKKIKYDNFEIDISNKDIVYCDIESISEAIYQIILNALEASEYDSKISLFTNKIIINNQSFLKFSIKDEGIGIEEKNLNKIFEPYFSTKCKKGIGLTKAMINISKNDGFITFEQNYPSGVIFNIFIPI